MNEFCFLNKQKKHTTTWEKGVVTNDVYSTAKTCTPFSSGSALSGNGSVMTCCQTNLCQTIGNQTLPTNGTITINQSHYTLTLFLFNMLFAFFY
jgi:hypothetical protein